MATSMHGLIAQLDRTLALCVSSQAPLVDDGQRDCSGVAGKPIGQITAAYTVDKYVTPETLLVAEHMPISPHVVAYGCDVEAPSCREACPSLTLRAPLPDGRSLDIGAVLVQRELSAEDRVTVVCGAAGCTALVRGTQNTCHACARPGNFWFRDRTWRHRTHWTD